MMAGFERRSKTPTVIRRQKLEERETSCKLSVAIAQIPHTRVTPT
jgi:hypothetical protein